MTKGSSSRKDLLVPLSAVAVISIAGCLAGLCSGSIISTATAQEGSRAAAGKSVPGSQIVISSSMPADIPGGAPSATLTGAAAFAWQEFIALNWPAINQTGVSGSNTRGVPDTNKKFGDDSSGADQASQPVVWETYRGKVETFPGAGNPPGYDNSNSNQDYGFDVGPQYNYSSTVPACSNPAQQPVAKPSVINLDEITQIGLDSMFAGLLPSSILNPTPQNANAQPQLIRFLAKGNRTFYHYVVANQYWNHSAAYNTAKRNFENAAENNAYPAPQPIIAFPVNPVNPADPVGTVLVKAAWRPLAASESASDFHTKTVRFYDQDGTDKTPCYREQVWALIALHIIHKTQTAPNFIFATFEHTNNILTPDGKPVEDRNGAEVNAPAGNAMDPQLNYFDIGRTYYSPDYPLGTTAPLVQVIGPYCSIAQNNRLYFRDLDGKGNPIPPANSGVCVNKRYFSIPQEVQQVNATAHSALSTYGAPALWQNYKLVNVQWVPFDISYIDPKEINRNRLKSTFSLANIVVETDNTLQQFFGGLFAGPQLNLTAQGGFFKSAFENHSSASGTAYNIYQPPSGSVPPDQFTRINMGGCMGCHGRAQRSGNDFSFTLAGGPVAAPDFAAPGSVTVLAGSRLGEFNNKPRY